MAEERVIKSEQIFDGKVVNLRVDTVEMADGHTFQREVIQHSGAVAMLALDEDGNVFLVRQWRAGSQKEMLELPAGGLEPDEPRIECARRELQEEIGYYPEQLEEMGGLYVASSSTTEYITIYLARGLRPSELDGDQDEHIEVVRMPLADAIQMAYDNEIEDSKTLIGLMWAAKHLGE